MASDEKNPKEAFQFNGTPAYQSTDQVSDSEAVEKLGIKPTVPRSLKRLISLIGVNSSVVQPWPTFYFVSVLNLANGGTAGLLVGTIVACVFMVRKREVQAYRPVVMLTNHARTDSGVCQFGGEIEKISDGRRSIPL